MDTALRVERQQFFLTLCSNENGEQRMSSRATNLSILVLLLLEVASGLSSFLVGGPEGRWVFWLHRAGGLALVLLIGWKWHIAVRSFRRRDIGVWIILPVALTLLFFGSLITGILWATVGLPRVPVPVVGSWTGLSLHVALGFALLPLLLLHTMLRWPQPRAVDFLGRRAILRSFGLLAGGLTLALGSEKGTALASLSGADRRFTGSREQGSFQGNAHPITNWLSDNTQRIQPTDWQLRIHGRVARESALTYDQILSLDGMILEALLDCTGGWYTVQHWSGAPLLAVLEQAGVQPGASSIVVRSATGYSRRFSVQEAERLLLATHVEGEPLSPGHGFPLRLVAPGARGYHWVKWVVSIEVSEEPSWWQSPLPLQ